MEPKNDSMRDLGAKKAKIPVCLQGYDRAFDYRFNTIKDAKIN